MANTRCRVLGRCCALLVLMGLTSSSGKRPSRVLNQNSPSMRRIMSEWRQVQEAGLAMGEGSWSAKGNSSDTFRLKPVGNMFEWHFTFLGARDSPYEGGLYHGSISLPADYPQSGPSVRLLNPNQRFKVGSRICLSASEYHQETWQPSWTITSLVTALVAHMTEPAAEIGSVHGATRSQKRKAAARSRSFECSICGCRHECFPEDRFPKPKDMAVKTDGSPRGGQQKKRQLPLAEDLQMKGGSVSVEDRRGTRGGEKAVAGSTAAAETGLESSETGGLAGRSRLSWIAHVLSSKRFVLLLVFILASLYLNQ